MRRFSDSSFGAGSCKKKILGYGWAGMSRNQGESAICGCRRLGYRVRCQCNPRFSVGVAGGVTIQLLPNLRCLLSAFNEVADNMKQNSPKKYYFNGFSSHIANIIPVTTILMVQQQKQQQMGIFMSLFLR
uniref:Uncharacterized protein n=1 Tax=Lactuca sativa TaxID=4236 RepID=A0A9R1X9I2_LACSA|nr:hypothetical protein LSAT_V11C500229230 [Lactuca sativa]